VLKEIFGMANLAVVQYSFRGTVVRNAIDAGSTITVVAKT
jgi:hypothetical protein